MWSALQGQLCPFLIDPSQRATEWLKVHLKESRLEVINQQVRINIKIRMHVYTIATHSYVCICTYTCM